MQKRRSDEKGFTLIEVIVTLVLVGITAALAGMWIVSIANSYVFAKMNASTAQKAQLAMTRLQKEFVAIRSVTSSGSAQIAYTRPDSILGVLDLPVILSLNGSALQLNVNSAGNRTLADSVSAFTLAYCDSAIPANCSSTWSSTSKIINIQLTLTGANGVQSTFARRVVPRNL